MNPFKKLYHSNLMKKLRAWPDSKMAKTMNRYSLLLHGVLACVIILVIETASRHSLISAFSFLFQSPLRFFYNAMLIYASLLLVYLVKRRILLRIVISVFWLLLGIINGVILASRVTPFNFTDLKLISDLLDMKNSKYVTATESALIIIGLGLLAVFLIFLAIRGPKFSGKVHRVRNLIGIGACVALIPFITKAAIQSDILSGYFGNLAQGYRDYGFVYSFSASVVDTGMNRPENYNEESIRAILDSESDQPTETSKKDLPNIIFVQLESFVDPGDLPFLTLSEDAVPNFHKLKENYSSGYLTVPVVGAGTANTEFEVMTGMSLQYFGLGEYPFKTILKAAQTESVATDLAPLGYSSSVLHNNGGNFYSRATVFRNLGYDSFVSKEEMNITRYNEINTWPTDDILVGETKKILNSTPDQPDYLYTITVQSHGSYPTEKVFADPRVDVTGAATEEANNQWEYYINEISEVDDYIGDLIKMLEKRDEKTIVVLYGDHLPTMGLTEEDVKSGNLFNTSYVTWNNFGLEKQDMDVTTYQLMARIMDQVGIHEGNVFKYHQTRMNSRTTSDPSYLDNLELLQYDLMYGTHIANGGRNFTASDMQMGVVDTKITGLSAEPHTMVSDSTEEEDSELPGETGTPSDPISEKLTANVPAGDASLENGKLPETAEDETESTEEPEQTPVILIRGENFTPWSKVYVNGEVTDTTYVSDQALEISPDAISDGCTLIVNQVGSGGTIFRQSNTLTIRHTTDLSDVEDDTTTSSGRYSVTSGESSTVQENTLQTAQADNSVQTVTGQ